MTNVELARLNDLAPSSMLERVRRLEERGIIRGYRAVLDPQEIGYRFEAMVMIILDRHQAAGIDDLRVGGGRCPRSGPASTSPADTTTCCTSSSRHRPPRRAGQAQARRHRRGREAGDLPGSLYGQGRRGAIPWNHCLTTNRRTARNPMTDTYRSQKGTSPWPSRPPSAGRPTSPRSRNAASTPSRCTASTP